MTTKDQKDDKYLCIDTNIFIQCCVLEVEGDNLEILTKLHQILDGDKIKLLLPEVVELEFYKILEKKTENIASRIGHHKSSIEKDDQINFKVKKDIIENIDKCLKDREENKIKVLKEIEIIFSHRNTIRKGLEITPEILTQSYKLFLSGKKPFKKSNQENKTDTSLQPDCLIIESLRNFFALEKENYDFYFCSQNTTDFSKPNPLSSNDVVIHDDLLSGFKNIKYYDNLGRLLKSEFSTDVSEEIIEKLSEKKDIIENTAEESLADASISTIENTAESSVLGEVKP